MNTCIVFVALFAVALSAPTDNIPIALKKIHDECQAEPLTHIKESVMEKLLKGEDAEDKNVGAHVLCMNVKLGIQKKNGNIEFETLRNHLSHFIHNEERLNKVMIKIGEKALESTAEETALHLLKESAKSVNSEPALSAPTDHELKTIKQIFEECQAEPATHIHESSMGHAEDKNIGAHTLCMNVGLGIQKKNGDIEVETLKKHLSHLIFDKERVNKVMAKVGVRAHDSTPEEAAVHLFKEITKSLTADRVLSAPTDNIPSEIKKIHDECQAEPLTHIKESAMEKLSKGEHAEDKNIGAHVLCMNVKLGVQKKNGDIEVEALKKLLSHLINDEEKLNKVMAKVGVRAHDSTPEEAALHLFKETAKSITAQRAHGHTEVQEIHDECQAETSSHVDESAMGKLVRGEIVEDINIGAHALCMNVGLGIQKKNGDIEVEPLKKHMSHLIHDEEKLNKVMAKLGVRAHGSTPEEAAITLFKGVAKNVPHETHKHLEEHKH